MSMPKFPTTTPSREEAINQILSSIAMEELGLSHIINAEGEKLQYVLGTLDGTTGPSATIEDVLNVNASVQQMLETTAYNQMFLKGKMGDALSASIMQGPTGAIGLMGLQGTAAVQPFTVGTSYLAGDLVEYNGQIYLVNVDSPTGTPDESLDYTLLSTMGATGATGMNGSDGPTGATGPQGPVGTLAGIQAQITDAPVANIAENQVLIFDKIIADENPNITYDDTTGAFTILSLGNYILHFWLNVNGSETLDGSSQVSVEINGDIYVSSLSPVTSGQFSGQSLITISAVPSVITLVNTTAGIMQLSDSAIQGGIMIYS